MGIRSESEDAPPRGAAKSRPSRKGRDLVACCLFPIAALATLWLGWLAWENRSGLPLGDDPAALRAAILRRTPIGTPIEQSRRLLETAGFSCQTEVDSEFSEHPLGATNGIVHEHLNFLYGDRQRWVGLLILRRWQVAVVHDKQNRVSAVYVSTGLDGP